MKRILHIAEAFGSGVFNYIKNLSVWQCEDYEVYVAYGIRPETPANFQGQFDPRIHFIRVDGFTREISPVEDWTAFRAIRRIVREIEPDLIHLHSTKAGVLGRWAVNCGKYRVLYSPHAYSFLMMDCSETKRKIYQLIEKISDRKGSLTIADIDGEYEASKKVAKRAICIPNGIDMPEMDEVIRRAEELKKDAQGFTVFMLGKIVPQKDPQMFNAVAEAFPDLHFLWIGEGPLRDQLTSPNIEITGWLSRPEAMARIMAADVFLFASAWESLSIALMEVMYVGKPCVVSKADGNRDVIRTGVSGFVCGTKEEYISAVEHLYRNREEAAEMGRAARQAIIDRYNTEVMKERYVSLFREIGLAEH